MDGARNSEPIIILIERLVRRWLRPLQRFAHYSLHADLRNEDMDIAEETLAICWRRLAFGQWSLGNGSAQVDVEQFSSFLFGTARRLVLNRNRKSRCCNEVNINSSLLKNMEEFRQPRPDRAFELGEKCAAVRQALSELPEDFRTILVLCHVESLPIEVVAAVLQVPAGTVKSRAARARTMLKKKLIFWRDDDGSGEREMELLRRT